MNDVRAISMRVLRCLMLLFAVALLTACATRDHRADSMTADTPFLARSLQHDGRTVNYRVFVPRRRGDTPLPVVLFLHGSGERGDDNVAQTLSGLGPHLLEAPDFPAIVVFPQSPPERNWRDDVAADAIAALADATRAFGGDPARTYLTGMSRGGYGVWEMALAYPGRFAALAPVCSGLESLPGYPDLFVASLQGSPDPYAALAQRLHATPIWAFHGARDDLVPPENSRRIVAALRAAGGEPRYTEFPEANHNSWDATYASPALWAWMFAQRLR